MQGADRQGAEEVPSCLIVVAVGETEAGEGEGAVARCGECIHFVDSLTRTRRRNLSSTGELQDSILIEGIFTTPGPRIT
jgi:hypothetical protein